MFKHYLHILHYINERIYMKEDKTHTQIFVKDKEKLEKIRDEQGLASIAVALKNILKDKK